MSAGGHSASEDFCANLARAQDFKSYAASLFVSAEARRSWLALAAFNAEVSQVRDHISQPLPGEIRLQWWRDILTGEGEGAAEANPVAAELLRAIKLHDLPVDTFVRLIDAHVFDVYDDPMPDMAALEAHCRDTAAAMFALRARVLGENSEDAARLSEHAGIAEGLVEVMLALPRHAARRQLYLPADLMNLHGAVAEEIFLHQANAPLEEVLTHLRREAAKQIKTSVLMLRDIAPAARRAFLPLMVTGKTLARLEASEPFAPQPLSRLGILWTMWRASNRKPFQT